MNRKLLISLGPMLVTAAAALLPAAAGAVLPPHYFDGGLGPVARMPGNERLPVDAWGTLTLIEKVAGGQEVTCHDVTGGVVENPNPGGSTGPAGVGETQAFAPYECESPQCTAASTGGGPATYVSLFAEGSAAIGTGTMTASGSTSEEPLAASGTNLRWTSVLTGSGNNIRQESVAVKLNVVCHKDTGSNAASEPEFGFQPSAVFTGIIKPLTVVHINVPPELVFGAGSTALTTSSSVTATLAGVLKTEGYNNEEKINAKEG